MTGATELPSPRLDERVITATTGALELFGIYLGDRLGLYRALRSGAATVQQLAERAQIAPRYAQEWLEQQAVAGVLSVDDVGADAQARRYELPDVHAGVVCDSTALDHVAPLARLVVGIASTLDEVAAAYRSGEGVPFANYGADLRGGQGAINRPTFSTALVDEWLPALGPIVERLAAGGRVADVACGLGWSTMAVARAFRNADVMGIDNDAASIQEAQAVADEQGLQVRFQCTDASSLTSAGPFDVVLLLEALHDLARPVDVLASIRSALADGGVLLLADEAVAPTFTAPGDELERMMYGWSITHCLPASMAEQPSAAIGTVIREHAVRELAQEAGFRSVDVLDVDGGFFRLYAVRA